jgi:hypothetical protein
MLLAKVVEVDIFEHDLQNRVIEANKKLQQVNLALKQFKARDTF